MDRDQKTDGPEDGKLRILSASRLLSRFHEHCPLEELYERASRNYETLIDILEDENRTREVASLINMPAVRIQGDVTAIIDLLLFNKENNPYTSLGLQKYAPISEVSRRWKRLIVLYHPDKYSDKSLDRTVYEEKAKRINEAHGEILKRKEKDRYDNVVKEIYISSPAKINNVSNFRYLKHLPTLIIVAVVIMALISIVLFIATLKKVL